MNNAAYFPHFANARNESRILRLRMKHGITGYGCYLAILERLCESSDNTSAKDYNMIAFDLRVDAGLIKSVIEDFGLFTFTENGECFYSEEITESTKARKEAYEKRSEAGRKNVQNRWKSENNSNAIPMLSENNSNAIPILPKRIASKVKIRKEKEKEREREKSTSDFLPPSLSDIFSFIESESLQVDGNRFFNFYEGNGWMMGKSKMHDWRAALRAWNSREPKDAPHKAAPTVANSIIIPTAEQYLAEKKRKDEAERDRIVATYNEAKKGKKRFIDFVKAWEEQGILAKYDLKPL